MPASSLYIDQANKKAVRSAFSTADGAIPAFVAGTTIDFTLRFLTTGAGIEAPYRLVPHAGASVVMRLRNAAGVYAQQTTWAGTAGPAMGRTITTVRDGAAPGNTQYDLHSEIQRITFMAPPAAGRYTPVFADFFDPGWGPVGSLNVPANADGATLAALINGMSWKNVAGGANRPRQQFLVTKISSTVFELNWNNQGNKERPTLDHTDLQSDSYFTGALTPADGFAGAPTGTFSDLFNPAQGPAYLEVLVTPSGGAQTLVLQQEVTQDGYVPPVDPAPVDPNTPSGSDVYYDGDFSAATPVSGWSLSSPLDVAPGVTMYRQTYRQLRKNFSKLNLNLPCPIDGNAKLVRETDRQDIGAGLVQWDRVYVQVPPDRFENGTWQKTIKTVLKQLTNGTLSAVSMVSSTKTVPADIWYFYSTNGSAHGIEGIPDVAINSVGVFTWVEPTNGFPWNPGSAAPDSNNFKHLLHAEKMLWMGGIYVLKKVYG